LVVDTHTSARSLKVSSSSFPYIGSPVSMMCFSSARAAEACDAVKKSKSVLPATLSIVSLLPIVASQPALTSNSRLSRSLKYTRSEGLASMLRMHTRSISSREENVSGSSDCKAPDSGI